MIEWWQAVLIALFPSLVTAAVAIRIQLSQQDHDTRMQGQRLESERRLRRDEALRRHLKERAEPLYDFLKTVEREHARAFLGRMLHDGHAKQRFEQHLHALDPALKERLDPVVWANLSAIWDELVRKDTEPAVRWQDMVKEYSIRLVLVGDEQLRQMLLELLSHIAGGQKSHLSEAEVSTLIRDAHARIATSIIDLPSDEREDQKPD
ncbi:MAG: hypothetical protein WD939_04050 [Dehalococcoidia bacterium]